MWFVARYSLLTRSPRFPLASRSLRFLTAAGNLASRSLRGSVTHCSRPSATRPSGHFVPFPLRVRRKEREGTPKGDTKKEAVTVRRRKRQGSGQRRTVRLLSPHFTSLPSSVSTRHPSSLRPIGWVRKWGESRWTWHEGSTTPGERLTTEPHERHETNDEP